MAQVDKEKLTRERIIEAAGRLFAEKGFKETTIRDICERADANVAAVNYHFRDKENLYEEIFRYIFDEITRKFPIDENLGGAKSNEERLYAFVSTLLKRMHDPEKPAWHGILFSRERMNPRIKVHSFFKNEVMKNRKILFSVIGDLLGPGAPPDQVKLCTESVISQVTFQGLIREEHAPPFFREEPLTAEMIEVVARHITEFSLGGIKHIRKSDTRSKGKKR